LLAEREQAVPEGLAHATANTEWGGAVGYPTRLLIGASRVADLIITASPEGPLPAMFIVQPISEI